jgi:poly-gamma-glutamate synthesis protein (capsule biosynthesis protein)
MANLETPIAPKTGKPGIPFCFNAPAELATALRETGIGLVFAANNHMYDQGIKGLQETIDFLLANNVLQAGCGMSREEALAPKIIELGGGIKVAILARTDIFNNNLNQRQDRPWVAALDLDTDEKIIKDARQRADAVIVGVHWGVEYTAQPNQRQRDAARRLVAAGADVIVGHHPHVLQPFEWVESGGRRGAVAFSLGNFLSNQDRMYNPSRQPLSGGDSRDGGMLWVSLKKDLAGALEIDARAEPIWTDNNCADYESKANSKRIIRVLNTRPGARGSEMEDLLAKRRAHALSRLKILDSPTVNARPPNPQAPAG